MTAVCQGLRIHAEAEERDVLQDIPTAIQPLMGCLQAVKTCRRHTETSPKLHWCSPVGSSGKQFVHLLGKLLWFSIKTKCFKAFVERKEIKSEAHTDGEKQWAWTHT